jgi:hypothetical protein
MEANLFIYFYLSILIYFHLFIYFATTEAYLFVYGDHRVNYGYESIISICYDNWQLSLSALIPLTGHILIVPFTFKFQIICKSEKLL